MATAVFAWSATTPNLELVTSIAPTTNNVTASVDGTMGNVVQCVTGQINIEWAREFITTSGGVGVGDFAVAIYAKPISNAAYTYMFAARNQSGAAPNAQMEILANGTTVFTDAPSSIAAITYNASGGGNGVGNGAAVDGLPHIFVYQRSGTTMELYQDNGLIGSGTVSAVGITQSGNYTAIGGGGNTSIRAFTGLIGWVQGFNAALTNAERAALARPSASGNTLSGGSTLADITGSGGFTSVAGATLSGGSTLDDLTGSGSMGAASGAITSQAFKNWSGTVQAGVTIPKIAAVRISDMAQVLTLTNQTTNGAGVLTIANAALTPGVSYLLVTCDSTGLAFGCEPYTAA